MQGTKRKLQREIEELTEQVDSMQTARRLVIHASSHLQGVRDPHLHLIQSVVSKWCADCLCSFVSCVLLKRIVLEESWVQTCIFAYYCACIPCKLCLYCMWKYSCLISEFRHRFTQCSKFYACVPVSGHLFMCDLFMCEAACVFMCTSLLGVFMHWHIHMCSWLVYI